jgi:hypothetical protein
MNFKINDIVMLLPAHVDFYTDRNHVRDMFIYGDGSLPEGYYTFIKILDNLKNKTVRAKIIRLCANTALVRWISTNGEYDEYVEYRHMKKISVINKPHLILEEST